MLKESQDMKHGGSILNKTAFRTITLFIASLLWMIAPSQADPSAGKALFDASGCNDCHYTEGPAREATIDDQLAKKGPELWYAGSKFQRIWLEAWLQNPEPIRPLKYNSLTEDNPADHPSVGAADAANTADFLMSLTVANVEEGVVTPKNNPRGRQIFTNRMPCAGCHQYEARRGVSGGRTGPTLVGAGSRLNPDWIFAYLSDPLTFKPVRMMPVFAGIMNERDMNSVAAYVAAFE